MNQSQGIQIGLVQIGIILLTLATAVMHLSLIFPDPLFILNGLGYVALLVALYLPMPWLAGYRGLIRRVLLGYTVITILAWVAIGQRDLYAYANKAIEMLLIILLWRESQQRQ